MPKKKTTKPIDAQLPVVDFYDGLPAPYKSVVSQQALALMQREGITNKTVEEQTAYFAGYAASNVGVQSRDLLCQLLIEQRKTNLLLEEVIRLAR